MVENGGVVSKAMVDAGYSENTAVTPSKLTNSKGWQELMDTYLPDDLLAEKHLALLNKLDEDGVDTQAVTKGLDMAYKLKGKYAPEKKEISGEIKTNTLTQEQIDKINQIALDE